MTKNGSRVVSTLVLAAGLGACDAVKALDPCSAAGACEVDGVDLIVDRLALSAPVITEINKPAVPVGSTIEVAYTLRNRGSQPSAATVVEFCAGSGYCETARKSVQLRALNPGETQSGSVSIVLSADIHGDGAVYADVQASDVDNGNSDVYTPVLFERPNLTATVQLLSGEQRVATPLRAEVRVRNQAYVAGAAASLARVCLQDYTTRCVEALGTVSLNTPALAAGATRTDTVSFPLPVSALDYPNRAEKHTLLVCADVSQAVTERSENDGCATGEFTALPNLDVACGPVAIAPGESVNGTLIASDCDFSFGSDGDVFRISAAANTRYTLHLVAYPTTQDAHIRALTDRGALIASDFYLNAGESLTFTTTQAGIYYFALNNAYSSTGHAYTVRLTQP